MGNFRNILLCLPLAAMLALHAHPAWSATVEPEDQKLIDAFRASSLVLVNDSGPMHLAALLRCRTHPITRISAIAEWLPPATTPVEGKSTPRGYRPHPAYMSDSAVEGWPSPQEIIRHLDLKV